jgi:hypothetical protein
VIVSVLLILGGLSLGKLYAQEDGQFIFAKFNIIRCEGEGDIEISIRMGQDEIEGGGIGGADVRLVNPEGEAILLKGKDNPAKEVTVLWDVEEDKFNEMFPKGEYDYVIDYGGGEVYYHSFYMGHDFPQKPTIVRPSNGATVPRSFTGTESP